MKHTSSNGKEVKVGDVVIYSSGTEQNKCIVRTIPTGYRGTYKLEVVQGGQYYYAAGHIFRAKDSVRMWVLDETSEEAVEKLIMGDSK